MESDVNIKEGYKKTAVGVIPEEWEVKPFNESFKHLRAYTVSRNELNYDENESCIYNIHYGDIHSTFPNSILDVEKNIKLIPVIINPELETPEFLKEGDLIMADASEDYEGIGKTIELVNVQDSKIVSGTHTFPLRPMTKFAPKYAGYIFTEFSVHKQIKRIATGISVFGVSKANISKIQLPIPPLPEQKAIANCLTTWDSGIEKLSALIKAKKEQKKGLMQQLLTGEKRLDGFEEEWREITLGDIGVFKTSSVNKKIEENETKVWLLNYMDVYRNTHISSKIKFQLTSAKQSQISSTNLKVGDVLFTPSSETPDDIGHSAVVIENLENVVYSYHLVRFRVKKNILDINFSGYVFNKSEILNEFSRRATGSTRYTLSVKDFNEVTTFLPPLKEQSKIAEVLTTADKEITLLEKKFERFKEQKRGLMQVLLTGERRLIN